MGGEILADKNGRQQLHREWVRGVIKCSVVSRLTSTGRSIRAPNPVRVGVRARMFVCFVSACPSVRLSVCAYARKSVNPDEPEHIHACAVIILAVLLSFRCRYRESARTLIACERVSRCMHVCECSCSCTSDNVHQCSPSVMNLNW